MQYQNNSSEKLAAFVGIDWADKEHAICLIADDLQTAEQLPHSAEQIDEWAALLLKRYDGRKIAVAIEQSKGSLVHALMQYPHLVLFPINPKHLISLVICKASGDFNSCVVGRRFKS